MESGTQQSGKNLKIDKDGTPMIVLNDCRTWETKEGKIYCDLTGTPKGCNFTFEYNYKTGEWERVYDED